MGTTCSCSRHQDVVVLPKEGSVATSLSDPVCSEETSLEMLDTFPMDLVSLLLEHRGHSTLTPGKMRVVCHFLTRSNLDDPEALAVYSVLSRVLDEESCLQAARSLNDRGYPSEAMACLRYLPLSEDVLALDSELQQCRLERWSRADVDFVEYTDSWGTTEIAQALERCDEVRSSRLQELSLVVPDDSNKFGVQGMVDDTPNPESLTLQWSKEGNMNSMEQEKSMSMWIKHHSAKHHPKMDNVFLFRKPPSTFLPSRLFSKPTCKLPGLRFVKVETLMAMTNLQPLESLPPDAFTSIGHFAVSHRRNDGTILQRLQKVLKSVDGILPTDGVFIDSCCAQPSDPLTTLFAKALFEQCHVIFLPSPDFFTRAWCTFECMTWLLSPYPTQALGDFDLGHCITLMCVYYFGRPVYCLDRPELQVLGRIAMSATDDDTIKDYLTWMLGDNRIKSTALRESLTKIIFKMESTITV